jgi:SnoaL-like domain
VGVRTVGDRIGVAKAVMQGFADRDVDRLLPLFTPDADFRTRVDVTGEAHFSGHEGVRAWLAAVDEKYDEYEILDEEYQAGRDDTVVMSCRLRLRYAGDRYGMSRMAYWMFRVDDEGCVKAFTSFRDLADAYAAAGVTDGGA